METYRYVLELIEDHKGLKKGFQLVGDRSYYSESSCAEDARIIAQGLFLKEGGPKYGYKCVKVEYEPPNLGAA